MANNDDLYYDYDDYVDYDEYDEYDDYEDYDEIESMQRVPDSDYPDLPFDQQRRRRPRRRPPIGTTPGRPPFGTAPGRPPQGPPSGPPSGSMPQGPPPNVAPRRRSRGPSFGGPSLYAVDPGAIWNCRYKYTYLWLEDGRSFWSWLVFVGRRSVAGYRWVGYGWVYFGTDLNNISDFVCY